MGYVSGSPGRSPVGPQLKWKRGGLAVLVDGVRGLRRAPLGPAARLGSRPAVVPQSSRVHMLTEALGVQPKPRPEEEGSSWGCQTIRDRGARQDPGGHSVLSNLLSQRRDIQRGTETHRHPPRKGQQCGDQSLGPSFPDHQNSTHRTKKWGGRV